MSTLRTICYACGGILAGLLPLAEMAAAAAPRVARVSTPSAASSSSEVAGEQGFVEDDGPLYYNEGSCPPHGYGYRNRRPARFPLVRGYWFRRYAGSIEMRTHTAYPPDYYGEYYFSPWRPSWVRDEPYPRPALDVDRFWHDPDLDFPHPHYRPLAPGEAPAAVSDEVNEVEATPENGSVEDAPPSAPKSIVPRPGAPSRFPLTPRGKERHEEGNINKTNDPAYD